MVQEIRIIEKVFAEWKTLSKSKSKESSLYAAFTAKLEQLFDIATKERVQRVQDKLVFEPSVERERTLEDGLDYYQQQLKPRAIRSTY